MVYGWRTPGKERAMQHDDHHEVGVDWSLVTMGVILVLSLAFLLAHLT